VHVQSHISESLDEIAFVHSLHPGKSDTEIFDSHGLLTPKTVMAHGIHLSPDERTRLRERGAAISHCPLSNFYFGDGLFNAKQVCCTGAPGWTEASLFVDLRLQGLVRHPVETTTSLTQPTMRGLQVVAEGNKLGLGTDIAGGYSPSMWNSVRKCVFRCTCYHLFVLEISYMVPRSPPVFPLFHRATPLLV
jgi:guanine deaminase